MPPREQAWPEIVIVRGLTSNGKILGQALTMRPHLLLCVRSTESGRSADCGTGFAYAPKASEYVRDVVAEAANQVESRITMRLVEEERMINGWWSDITSLLVIGRSNESPAGIHSA
jgi:hypothetical protein